MKNLYIISKIAVNALQESFRRRVMNVLLVFSAILVISLGAFSHMSAGDHEKFVKDIGLSSVTFFCILIAIFGAASLIPNEIEKRTIFNILSKPVSRGYFLFGKLLGTFLIVFVNFLIMSVLFLTVLMFTHLSVGADMFKALYLLLLEVLLVAAITLTVSTVASTIFNVSFSFFVFIFGNLSEYMSHNFEHMDSQIAKFFAFYFNRIMPDFSVFNMGSFIVLGKGIELIYLVKATIYMLIYMIACVSVGYVLFNRREM